MGLCARCGEDNPGRARFCLRCGSELLHEPAPRERKLVTVLFCDLVGFTAISERLDPEDVQALLTSYQAAARRKIEHFGGSVERFVGDGVLAVFGIPKAHEDDPERAVRAALAIVDELSHLDVAGDTQLAARVGIDTGEVLVNWGVDSRHGDVVTGDVVNTASRLEHVATPNTVLVGETTLRATRKVIEYETLQPLSIKGKAQPVPVWQALGTISRFGVDTKVDYASLLVGRDHELELLKGSFLRTLKETSVQLVTITGEPGVGKSRLVAELSTFVDDQPERVSWRQGRCLPYGDGISFWALGEIIKAHAGILESDGPRDAAAKLTRVIEAVVPDDNERFWFKSRLAPLVGAEITRASSQVEKEESFTAWRRFLEAIAASGPLVLVVEDLHWADASLVEFLEHLIDWAAGVALLVVCTARPELYERYAGWGGGKRNSTTVALSPLSDMETGQLLSNLLTRAVVPSDIRAAIIERAGGNPLFTEEFVRMLTDRGMPNSESSAPVGPLGHVTLPESLQTLIAARLDTIKPSSKELLCAAAVLGKVFWSGAVAQITGQPRERVRNLLHELATKEFIRPARVSSMSGEDEYAFRHALLRDVAYAQMPRAVRAQRHEAAAGWLEKVAGARASDHAELLVYHYENAMQLKVASGSPDVEDLNAALGRSLVMAGDRSVELDVAKADSFYSQALALMANRGAESAPILLKRAKSLLQLGRLGEAQGCLEGAIEGFEERRDVTSQMEAGDTTLERVEALTLLAEVLDLRGDFAPKGDAIQQAVRIAENSLIGPALVTAYIAAMADAMTSARTDQAVTLANKAIRLAEAHKLEQERISALGYRGAARFDQGDIRGIEDVKEALSAALRNGFSYESSRWYFNLVYALNMLTGPAAALALNKEAIAFADSKGMSEMTAELACQRAEALIDVGQWDKALSEIDRLLSWFADHGPHSMEMLLRCNKTIVQAFRGKIGPRLPFDEYLTRAREAQKPYDLAAVVTSEILTHAWGDLKKVPQLIHEVLKNARGTGWLPNFPHLARAAVGCGRVDLLELLIDSAPRQIPRARLAITGATALLEETRGRFDCSAELYGEAADAWGSFGIVLEQGLSLLGCARCYWHLGTPAAARSTEEARDTLGSLGITVKSGKSDALLGGYIP